MTMRYPDSTTLPDTVISIDLARGSEPVQTSLNRFAYAHHKAEPYNEPLCRTRFGLVPVQP